jgi:hypothetical protein
VHYQGLSRIPVDASGSPFRTRFGSFRQPPGERVSHPISETAAATTTLPSGSVERTRSSTAEPHSIRRRPALHWRTTRDCIPRHRSTLDRPSIEDPPSRDRGRGQISQTADQVAAINGNNLDASSISLRNVHVAYPNSEEYSLEAGGKAQLVFTVVNTSEYVGDALEGIETEGADEVTFVGGTGSIDLPPQTALAAGAPADQEPQDPEEPSSMILVELEGLSEFVRPGLTVPMTFQFAEAGDVTIEVPVDAGPTPRVTNEKSGPHEEEAAAAEGE